MKKRLMALLIGCACVLPVTAHAADALNVAVAANVQSAMEEIARAFAAAHTITVNPIFSSSGKLTAQIKAGAPYHLFVSADMGYPEKLYKDGFATAAPQPYALGSLVLWSMTGADLSRGLPSLASGAVRKVAIPNPDLAPYGVAAVEALSKTGQYQAVQPKLVYAESISQSNQFIVTGTVQAGFTARSTVLSPAMSGKGTWVEIDPKLYADIVQGAVITKYGAANLPEASRLFLDFLHGPKAREILTRHGYRLP